MNYTFNDPNSQWINQQQMYHNVGVFGDQPLTPQALIANKDDCQLMENQLFNEFSSGIKQEKVSVASNDNFGTHSNISDNSSPSAILNNVPLSNMELNSLNSTIQNNNFDNEKLTEEELADRRKAQNRAAQRAFRERKEMKLKELRDQLDQSETDKAQLLKELEELKKQNIVISTENKLLLENSSSSKLVNDSNTDASYSHVPGDNDNFTFPDKSPEVVATQERYFTTSNQLTNQQIPYEFKRLTIPEVWDYLTQKTETLDFEINDIMDRIKGLEVCHERGPAYPLVLVDKILQQGVNQF